MRMTQQQYDAINVRLNPAPDRVDRERDLHDAIEADLNLRRWYYVHSRMDKPTTNQMGTCDFIISAPNGITFWIEVKKPGGKLSEAQTVTRHVLLALGHRYATVYSMREYLDFIDPPNQTQGAP